MRFTVNFTRSRKSLIILKHLFEILQKTIRCITRYRLRRHAISREPGKSFFATEKSYCKSTLRACKEHRGEVELRTTCDTTQTLKT